MASDTTLMPAPGAAAPAEIEPEILTLRTQLVSAGHTKDLLASTDNVTFHMHCYGPKGGENGLHAHMEEDHIFVVLQGEAQFSGLNGPLPVLKKNQALMLPKGCFYSFSNEGTEPLVMIRFGTVIPNAPGNVGLYQAVTVLAMGLFGVDKSTAAGFSFVMWFATSALPPHPAALSRRPHKISFASVLASLMRCWPRRWSA